MHAVNVVAEDNFGCIGEATGVVEVLPTPEVDWSLASDRRCGLPADIPVELPGDGADVHWNVNGELAAIGDSVVLSVNTFGWQAIEAVVTNGVGCSQSVLDSLETLPLPQAQLSAEPSMGCSPLEVELAFDVEDAEASMSWVSGEQVVQLAQLDSLIAFSQPGAYQVQLDLVDDRGCENTVQLGDSILVLPSPNVDFEPSPYAGTWDNPDPLNSTWSFENLSDAGQALWDFGDGGMSTIWDGSHTYEAPGTYTVHVMVVNEAGCAGEAVMEVEVLENLQVFVPNAFTPPTNGYSDGVNDGWRPEVSEPDLVDSYWLRVFNRYGQLIWETFDSEEYWIGEAQRDGEFFGMNDAYTWVLRIESRAQRPAQREWRGHVTLIR
jgi:PKD repeat protein